MLTTLKIFFIVLGLGIFILPKQMIYAQSSTECCEQNSPKKECCKKEKTSSCHSQQSKNNSEKNNCGDDCNKCHSCTVHFVMNYLTPEFTSVKKSQFSDKKSISDYSNSYYSFSLQNIWQPPKIG